jgi:L-aspartate oxidase
MDKVRTYLAVGGKPATVERHDAIVVGSGVAGVYTVLNAPEALDIVVVTKETLDISNSSLAQGGIAVSLGRDDSPELHLQDTLYAGAGLCDEDVVRVLVNEARPVIQDICTLGVDFDRKTQAPVTPTAPAAPEGVGQLALNREAAHSQNRIIHAGDTTGKEVCDKLTSVMLRRPRVSIRERTIVLDLLVRDGICCGVSVYDEGKGEVRLLLADVVVCATGGYGQLYAATTNPDVATGDGACFAYRAGADLMDLEFVQFHPTVLFHPQNRTFLISEAVRGEGALLRNLKGERFMPAYHEMAELAPRDVVSRSIFAEMTRGGDDHVWLDITARSRKDLQERFPNIYRTCLGYGIDMSKDFVPVAPAEHYCMGGIRTDVFGRTGIPGFYACGEAACNGIHGANRLASNSLLEGLVFGRRIGEEMTEVVKNRKHRHDDAAYFTKALDVADPRPVLPPEEEDALRTQMRRLMTDRVGIVRTRSGMEEAKAWLATLSDRIAGYRPVGVPGYEFRNLVLLARLTVEMALAREESRGAHFREDFPHTDDAHWLVHQTRRRDDGT